MNSEGIIENGKVEKANFGKFKKIKLLINEFFNYMKKKDYLLLFLSILLFLPLFIYLLTNYSKNCENNYFRSNYDLNLDKCYCKNGLYRENLDKYLLINENIDILRPVNVYGLAQPILENYKYSFINEYNIIDEIMNINFRRDKMQIEDIKINDLNLTLVQVVSLIPRSTFEILQSSEIRKYNLNTNEAYTMMLNIEFNNTVICCTLTSFNETFYNMHFTDIYPNYLDSLIKYSYQLNDTHYLRCQGFNFIYGLIDTIYIYDMMKSLEFKDLINKANNSVIHIMNDQIFSIKPPKYCRELDYCLKSECFGYELLTIIILNASLYNLIYMFFKFMLHVIYKIKNFDKNEENKIEMIILSKQ